MKTGETVNLQLDVSVNVGQRGANRGNSVCKFEHVQSVAKNKVDTCTVLAYVRGVSGSGYLNGKGMFLQPAIFTV